ncbi:MAG: DUF2721 domain-containing protein [Verrucomicrobia bacterium]|nr:MAG: DUF2721 domain-containing protein [Verrucomicrobiota bacterium]
MPITPLRDLIPVLQEAIGPVILISGVGLLLLTLTNRFGRAIDRSRQLVHEMRQLAEPDRQKLAEQVRIIYRRATIIRSAITFGVLCVLLVSILIIVLFLSALLRLEVGPLISLLFISTMASLIISLTAFLSEIHLSLIALKLELGDYSR